MIQLHLRRMENCIAATKSKPLPFRFVAVGSFLSPRGTIYADGVVRILDDRLRIRSQRAFLDVLGTQRTFDKLVDCAFVKCHALQVERVCGTIVGERSSFGRKHTATGIESATTEDLTVSSVCL